MEKSMAQAEVIVNLPRAEIWSRLRDLSCPQKYVPGLRDCRMTTERKEGVGASRRVYTTSGMEMDETVVEWNEGQGFVIKLHDGSKPPPPIFTEARFHYLLEDIPGGKTCFKPTMTYTLKFGVLGVLLDRLMINWIVRSNMKKVGLGFKQFYETGRPSNPAYKA
ncbi:MAG: SRPBCC family protein [Sterolibacterium sp.]|nr:SRPBCC family protein [Sterolibacterium sp.]MBP9799081.1 SRPBCC family protein [Sterolibacterium sp.]